MHQDPDYFVDIGGMDEDQESSSSGSAAPKRNWIGVRFDCCQVYQRVYKNADGTAYEGRCPHCNRQLIIRVGPDGTPDRFFRAS